MPTTVEDPNLAPLLNSLCFSCQTHYLTQSIIVPTDDLARRGLVPNAKPAVTSGFTPN